MSIFFFLKLNVAIPFRVVLTIKWYLGTIDLPIDLEHFTKLFVSPSLGDAFHKDIRLALRWFLLNHSGSFWGVRQKSAHLPLNLWKGMFFYYLWCIFLCPELNKSKVKVLEYGSNSKLVNLKYYLFMTMSQGPPCFSKKADNSKYDVVLGKSVT